VREREKEDEAKSPESDLRRPVCREGDCKERSPKEPPQVEGDLRRPVVICKDGPCPCPPGETRGANGACMAGAVTSNMAQCPPGASRGASGSECNACPANQYWNGASCIHQCAGNETWDGASCVSSTECASISAQAALLANEVRMAKGQMQTECRTSSTSQQCNELAQSYQGAVERYRMLVNQAPPSCRTRLPDPLAL
jgi:hypothetical protein